MAKDKKKKNKSDTQSASSIPNPAPAGAAGQSFSAPPPAAPADGKKNKKAAKAEKKSKKKGPDVLQNNAGQIDFSNMSPDQISQMQLEEAIKESTNPAMKLKKLKSPFNVKSCIINAVVLILLTLIATFVFIWLFRVDKFDFGYVAKDMLSDFGITQAFSNFFRRLGNLFTGKGWTLSVLLTLLP